MAKSGLTLEPIQTAPGVQPGTDKTNVSTVNYVWSDKVRFENGIPRKQAGWKFQSFDYNMTVQGVVRSIFTEYINGNFYVMIGSNEKLYSMIGSRLTNITPFRDSSIAVPNSLSTNYNTLSNNPFSTTNGSSFVTVTDPNSARFQAGDTVYFSGATSVGGISSGDINGDTIVRSVGVGSYQVNFGVTATSSATGGGAAVNRSSGLITLSDTAHGLSSGDRVKIINAATFGGINATDINKEFIIRNTLVNTFDFMTTGQATSAVVNGGGPNTEYFPEIPPGNVNESVAQGYGAGLYGVGLYGTALVSNTGQVYPRVWYMDRYANTIVATPGNGSSIYQWFGDNNTAPVIIANAPEQVNYAFVSDNILVTLGAYNAGNPVENRIFASDQNDINTWTSSSTNQVYDDDIEGASKFISHCPIEDYNLLFTEHQVYSMRYIGLPFVWEVKLVDKSIGLIAPMARVPVKGTSFWMGQNNFYMFRGGTVEVVRANTQDENTLLNYVFQDLNWGQKSKIFAWYNKDNNEVWFHYPSANSNEPDRVVVVNVLDFTWWPHTMQRTAAEYPSIKTPNPYLANENIIIKHELGVDDNDQSLPWTITTNKRFYGKNNFNLNAIIPDDIQDGTIMFTDTAYLYPQSTVPIYQNQYDVISSTERIPVQSSARFHQYTWEGNELGQNWKMGTWFEEVQKGPLE